MKPEAYLSHEELARIEARVHRMRAEATAEAFFALRNWLRKQLTFGATHKA
ncbi:MAG: hypothetical protein AAGA38_01190 [Pseudomonadota bacterium]